MRDIIKLEFHWMLMLFSKRGLARKLARTSAYTRQQIVLLQKLPAVNQEFLKGCTYYFMCNSLLLFYLPS